MKKKSIKKFGIVAIICSILLCIGIVTVSPAEAFADSVMPSFESFTDSDDYYYNGIKRNISEYELSMHKGNALNYIVDENYGESGKYACTIKYAQDPETNIMRLIASGDGCTEKKEHFNYYAVNKNLIKGSAYLKYEIHGFSSNRISDFFEEYNFDGIPCMLSCNATT